MSGKFRIGSVSYLNAAPLIFELEEQSRSTEKNSHDLDFEIIKAVPSELSRQMAAGELDVALMPIIDYCAGTGAGLVPGIALACVNLVGSVLLFAKKPLPEIKTIGHVTASKSSVALLHVLMREKWGIEAMVVPSPESGIEILTHHDAALIIGDEALQLWQHTDFRIYDLGGEWVGLTQLPFVFAAWVLAEDSINVAPLVRLLQRAKEAGLRRLSEVIDRHLGVANMDRAALERYFTENMNYDFTDKHLEGVRKFQHFCHKHGCLAGAPRKIGFISG